MFSPYHFILVLRVAGAVLQDHIPWQVPMTLRLKGFPFHLKPASVAARFALVMLQIDFSSMCLQMSCGLQ
jgi:hypothetical protein